MTTLPSSVRSSKLDSKPERETRGQIRASLFPDISSQAPALQKHSQKHENSPQCIWGGCVLTHGKLALLYIFGVSHERLMWR